MYSLSSSPIDNDRIIDISCSNDLLTSLFLSYICHVLDQVTVRFNIDILLLTDECLILMEYIFCGRE